MVHDMLSLNKVFIVYFLRLVRPPKSCLICQVHTAFKGLKATLAEKFSDELMVITLH